jgi:hypothetical protein
LGIEIRNAKNGTGYTLGQVPDQPTPPSSGGKRKTDAKSTPSRRQNDA